MSAAASPASASARTHGDSRRSSRSFVSTSIWSRVSSFSKLIGAPCWSFARNGNCSVTSRSIERTFFAASHDSLRRDIAIGLVVRSTRYWSNTSSTTRSRMRRSQSSPPSALSPPVASTSKIPLSTDITEMSNVPPPRSNTAIRRRPLLTRCAPYASAAAVGSLRMRTTSRPAIWPASRVAWRCASSKYAGTVMMARVTGSPSASSATFRTARSTWDAISCGEIGWP